MSNDQLARVIAYLKRQEEREIQAMRVTVGEEQDYHQSLAEAFEKARHLAEAEAAQAAWGRAENVEDA